MPKSHKNDAVKITDIVDWLDNNAINLYTKRIKRLRFWLRVCMYGWFITLLSGAAILYTGKIPPIEMPFKKPAFGSEYPNEFWYRNNGK